MLLFQSSHFPSVDTDFDPPGSNVDDTVVLANAVLCTLSQHQLFKDAMQNNTCIMSLNEGGGLEMEV